MPSLQAGYAPNLGFYLKSLKAQPVESSIENLISLLKRRQITNSRPCAVATAHLLLQVVAKFRWTNIDKLIERIQDVGRRLIEAQPREMVVGNIVRRVLGMVRDEAKEERNDDASDSASNSQMGSPRQEHIDQGASHLGGPPPNFSPLRYSTTDDSDSTEANGDDVFGGKTQAASRPPLITSHTSYAPAGGLPPQKSMFQLLSANPSPASSPSGAQSPHNTSNLNATSLSHRLTTSTKDLKAEVIEGIEEIVDELDQADDRIAAQSLEYIHSNEVILTHSSSRSVQKFLLEAAKKRKFTVIIAESYPNDHEATHKSVTRSIKTDAEGTDELTTPKFSKSLSDAGITVILMTDATIFAIMSRVNKVILATHAVIANGGLIAAAGARIIAKAARVHRTPVIVVSGVYKLSPQYPFEFESLIEYGDPGNIVRYQDGALVENLEVDNPVYDYVPPDLVDLYITNIGAHAPSYLYRIVADHYKTEDINFDKPELQ
ncbi:putative translation initiation factor eIF-2B subunit beta [Lachnellula hyalina]|uniref:Translation initiation factor eIF2B subunit beta n=1 Tax=Lachnellula hyalina TaxID=1316788 RepID=A0A8H8QX87_9HELO|nr:putative translation initiation factor eIF-2B subunit beta [Lachnellula hyalina]TVY24363.1 putative translation initiation factor eIF-2B subunit beta [Lachnellula hyalina]